MKNKLFHILSKFAISRSRLDSSRFSALLSVKRHAPMVQHFLRSLYALGGTVTPNWVRIIYFYLRKLSLLKKHQGIPGVVKTLKVCSVLVQQVCAGYVLSDITPLGMRISRSKSGLPRLIPSHQRKLIMKGSRLHVRFWLTIFSIYRDLHFDGELKLKTIIAPSTASSDAFSVMKHVHSFTALYWKEGDIQFPIKAFGPFQILTSGPQVVRRDRVKEYNSHFNSVIRSMQIFLKAENQHLLDSLSYIIKFTDNDKLKMLWNRLYALAIPKVANIKAVRRSLLGALAVKEEAAGKVRVFAMVDPWTQWALRPLHKNLFKVLSRLPMDGTFNQMAPLKRVPFGEVPIYSFDLSAATDRLPIWLQEAILSSVWGKDFGKAWKVLLVDRDYSTPKPSFDSTWKIPKGDYPSSVRYSVGQPMGALSSWAMLAITHHYIVHYCAWMAGVTKVGTQFSQYALLGDDIVIWNSAVAKRYLTVMKQLGVEIGLAKSIISTKGSGLEFAKKTILSGLDVSPIPFKDMTSAHRKMAIAIEFMRRYSLDLNSMLRFLGYGYKVDATKDSAIVRAFKLALIIPKSYLELISIFKPKRDYIDFKAIDCPIHQVKKHLILTLNSGFRQTLGSAKRLYYDLIGYQAGVYVSSIGPWRSKEAILACAIAEQYTPQYLRDLKIVIGICQYSIDYLDKYVTYCNSPYWSIFHDQWVPSVNKFIPEANNLLSSHEKLDAIQVDLLLKPSPVPSQSPKYFEEKRTIQLWNRWSKVLSKVGVDKF